MEELSIKPKYVTKADYLLIKGINLDVELPDDDDPANASNRFIWRVEQKVVNFLATKYFFNDERDLNEKNINKFKLAIIEQIEYEITNGKHSEVCDGAKLFLRNGGLLNIKIGRPVKSGMKRWY